MNRPSEELKSAAIRLAMLLASPEGDSVIKALARFDPPKAPISGPGAAEPVRIGIWEKTTKRGQTVYVRRTGDQAWSLWAQVGMISLRPRAKRVLFLGESVARGYFYDPHFNPAQALEAMLRRMSATDEVDIIDLARVGIERQPLLELAKSSVALDPAAMVIFAGNNWHPSLSMAPNEVAYAADLIRQTGNWGPIKAYMEEKLRSQVRSFLEGVAAVTQERRIPVVYVIPEFNLGDWRDNGSPPPLFDSSQCADWAAFKSRLCSPNQQCGDDAIALAAECMTKLDVGTSPLPWYARADCALRDLSYRTARAFLEKARDAGFSLPQVESPRCYSAVQEVIRNSGPEYGYAVVDLPASFQVYMKGRLPDRRLFHDYCHLTVDGIRIAMAATAKALQPLLKLKVCREVDLISSVPGPTKAIMAEAWFLAAVHNANWGQPQSIVEHHCRKAVEHSSSVAELMLAYLDSHLRREPAALCASFDAAISRQSLSATNILFAPPRRSKALSLAIVGAISNTLAVSHPDRIASLDRLLKVEHGLNGRTVDILERQYCAPSFPNFEGTWQENWAFYRAFDRSSRFTLIADRPGRAKVELVYRAKTTDSGACVWLRMNDKSISMLSVSDHWQRGEADIEVLSGINTVQIDWPMPTWSNKERIERAAATLEVEACKSRADGELKPVIYPVYGELHCLRVHSLLT